VKRSIAAGLNDDHRRVIGAAFSTIDTLLSEAERAAACARQGTEAPLTLFEQDLGPAQQEAIQRGVAELRAKMAAICARCGISRVHPRAKSSWAVQNALTFAAIALRERTVASLKRIGPVSAEAEAALEEMLGDLLACVARQKELLQAADVHEGDRGKEP
jgi:hypothetical protein